MFTLKAENLTKKFGRRTVFSSVNLNLNTGDSIALTGANGSGKTTLIRLLLKLNRPTSGEVLHQQDSSNISESDLRTAISFVAPYLNLYDQLTAEENLKFFAAVRGFEIPGKEIEAQLERVGLSGRGMDLLSSYSTGMKQRLKYAVALSHRPQFLFLDEPMTALDETGKAIVKELIELNRNNCITVIATNETEEYALAQQQCRLGE